MKPSNSQVVDSQVIKYLNFEVNPDSLTRLQSCSSKTPKSTKLLTLKSLSRL